MTKPRVYGTTKAVVAALTREAGGAKRVAHLLERSESQVYAYSDPNEDAALTLDQARKIVEFSPGAALLADDFAALAGGVFLPAPQPNANVDAIAAETAEEWGAFIASLLHAHASDDLTGHREKHPHLRARLDHLLAHMGQLRAALIALEQP